MLILRSHFNTTCNLPMDKQLRHITSSNGMSFMKHTDEIQYLKSSPDIIQMIKIIIMRCVGHVAQIYEMKNALKIWFESLNGRDRWKYVDIEGRVLLRWILKEKVVSCWFDQLVLDMVQLRAVANTIISLLVP